MTSQYLEQVLTKREVRAKIMLLAERRRGRLSPAEVAELRLYLAVRAKAA